MDRERVAKQHEERKGVIILWIHKLVLELVTTSHVVTGQDLGK